MKNNFPTKLPIRNIEYDYIIGNKIINNLLSNNIEEIIDMLKNGASLLMPFSIDLKNGHVLDFIVSNTTKEIFDKLLVQDIFLKSDNLEEIINNNEHFFSKENAKNLVKQLMPTDDIEYIEKLINKFKIEDEINDLIVGYTKTIITTNNNINIFDRMHINENELLAHKLCETNPNLVVWLLYNKKINSDFGKKTLNNTQFNNLHSYTINHNHYDLNNFLHFLEKILKNNFPEINAVLLKENLEKDLDISNKTSIKPKKI